MSNSEQVVTTPEVANIFWRGHTSVPFRDIAQQKTMVVLPMDGEKDVPRRKRKPNNVAYVPDESSIPEESYVPEEIDL